ncbi:MAG TPA: DUF808 domain-containing protein [Pseudobdellovibrionaceae bacterium]|nr:DUF808 domain-containing protein [Pseudobdellovibrionaceae bacterium]
MAGSSLFTLIDDIASVLDDVAVLTKVAAKKTSGVLGDDLALNAQQVSGIHADRELPVVFAVAKGSLINKIILVPLALFLSYFIPVLIPPLLILGGLYLCYEGSEKVLHTFFKKTPENNSHHQEHLNHLSMSESELLKFEKDKIKGAIKTDFILSAEIITITLGTVSAKSLMVQLSVLSGISLLMTVGVYGLVAGIVKIDDFGLYLISKDQTKNQNSFSRRIGNKLVILTPYLMRILSVVGTLAMFLVGGGLLVHGIPLLHHAVHVFSELWGNAQGLGALIAEGGFGFLAGLLCIPLFNGAQKSIAGIKKLSTLQKEPKN